jgi:hypothetical protein
VLASQTGSYGASRQIRAFNLLRTQNNLRPSRDRNGLQAVERTHPKEWGPAITGPGAEYGGKEAVPLIGNQDGTVRKFPLRAE